MVYDTLYFVKDILIVVLIFTVVFTVRRIRILEKSLALEIRKRSMPLVSLEVNTDDDLGLFLVNDSYCYAKHIRSDDLDVIVDYGFKKHLTVKINPVDFLKPNQRVKLAYSVFDGQYDITATDAKTVIRHFADAPLEILLRYENIEGNPFSARIATENKRYILKEVAAL